MVQKTDTPEPPLTPSWLGSLSQIFPAPHEILTELSRLNLNMEHMGPVLEQLVGTGASLKKLTGLLEKLDPEDLKKLAGLVEKLDPKEIRSLTTALAEATETGKGMMSRLWPDGKG